MSAAAVRRSGYGERTKSGRQIIGYVASESEPGVDHAISRASTGLIGCDCMSYRFKKGAKFCKHTEAWARAVQAGLSRATPSIVLAPSPAAYTAAAAARAPRPEVYTVRSISFDDL